jgi:hypothetical protein
MDGKCSPSCQPYYFQKLLCKWGALSIAFTHVNQKSCSIDGEFSLCGTSSNEISASYKFFSLFAIPWFRTNKKSHFLLKSCSTISSQRTLVQDPLEAVV